ncbi:protein of unknown function [Magnetospira sp. QH-2]|nr:protein of unknown function [Magnetospira sp. QH-2]
MRSTPAEDFTDPVIMNPPCRMLKNRAQRTKCYVLKATLEAERRIEGTRRKEKLIQGIEQQVEALRLQVKGNEARTAKLQELAAEYTRRLKECEANNVR